MLHSIIKDEDIGYINKDLQNPRKRIGARGIVLKDNKIALFYKKNMNEYKLPGGGVDENEEYEDAFLREVLEETGCRVNIIKKLGITEEFKGNTNFYQISHIYLSKVVEDTHKIQITEKEAIEGGSLLWVTLDQAIDLVKDCFNKVKSSTYDKEEDVYSTKFVVKRDLTILEYYKKLLTSEENV